MVFQTLCHLAEFDRRRLHERTGFASLFAYCVQELGYSEDTAANRIRAARTMRRFPSLRERLRSGALSLSSANVLAAHLDEENHRALLDQACGKSKREVERLVAALVPRPDPRDRVRRFCADNSALRAAELAHLPIEPTPLAMGMAGPTDIPDAANPSVTPRPAAAPEVVERVRIAFSASDRVFAKLERARGLLRHRFPAGKLEEIFETALDALLERHDPDRRIARAAKRDGKARGKEPGDHARLTAATRRSRRIPQAVRDEVWMRDGGRCVFVSAEGRRCDANEWLEYDHVRPWALGGSSDAADNVRLLCRAHNQMLARLTFGDRARPRGRDGNESTDRRA